MKNIDVKKREWVKNAAIIFLAVMLVLTFFSNTIMNCNLPEVATQYTTTGTITARIRGTGIVSAVESFEVEFEQTRRVGEVFVSPGDEVSRGDVLFTLEGEGEELVEMKEDMRELERELRNRERLLEEAVLESSRPDGSLASANLDIQRARDELALAQSALAAIPYNADALSRAQDANNTAQNELSTAESRLLTINRDLELARRHLDTFTPPIPGDPLYDAALAEVEALERREISARYTRDNARTSATAASQALDVQEGYRDRWVEQSDIVRARQQELEDMTIALSVTQANAGVDSAQYALTLSALRADVEETRDEISRLQEKIDEFEISGRITEVTSLVNGVVTERNVTPGQPAEAHTVLMRIDDVDRGYTINIRVSAEQAARVSIGEIAQVERAFWSMDEVTAVLSAIRNDPENPVLNRLLVFNIRGDVESGTELTVTVAQRSENYSIVVPNAALRSDPNGDFILVVMTRESPLGNRFIATREGVNILASDDTHTAVSGALTGWDLVITQSTQPINPGMQVRLVDNP